MMETPGAKAHKGLNKALKVYVFGPQRNEALLNLGFLIMFARKEGPNKKPKRKEERRKNKDSEREHTI